MTTGPITPLTEADLSFTPEPPTFEQIAAEELGAHGSDADGFDTALNETAALLQDAENVFAGIDQALAGAETAAAAIEKPEGAELAAELLPAEADATATLNEFAGSVGETPTPPPQPGPEPPPPGPPRNCGGLTAIKEFNAVGLTAVIDMLPSHQRRDAIITVASSSLWPKRPDCSDVPISAVNLRDGDASIWSASVTSRTTVEITARALRLGTFTAHFSVVASGPEPNASILAKVTVFQH